MLKRLSQTIIICSLLAGCAAGGEASSSVSPSPAVSTPPADGGTFATVLDLKKAYVDAGGPCPSFNQGNRVTLAAESADCDTETVLSTYVSPEDISSVIQNLKKLDTSSGYKSSTTLLVGKNWIINNKQIAKYREKLGGTVVSF
ncbi:hypothetical protein AB0N65_06780 [Paenarthrobacter sp. NPDC089322]|uniref:hypothetical protein n=1 Tax=Paenarthrobacter sp. NPDC089322 TaxID=3155065 RepID=UPI003446A0D1